MTADQLADAVQAELEKYRNVVIGTCNPKRGVGDTLRGFTGLDERLNGCIRLVATSTLEEYRRRAAEFGTPDVADLHALTSTPRFFVGIAE